MIYHFSAAGRRHRQDDLDNQDALAMLENERYAVIALADGVSSCSRAREGAQCAALATAELLFGSPDYFFLTDPKHIAHAVLAHTLDALSRIDPDVRPLSSTLSFALWAKEQRQILLFQLGNGLTVGSHRGRCVCLLQPDDAEPGACVTTTPGAEARCRILSLDNDGWNAFMLLTDGAWQAFVRCGMLRETVAHAFLRRDFDALRHALQSADADDDHSFAILTID